MAPAPMGEWIRREYARMVGFVRQQIHLAGEMDAEDLVQDVVLALLERADPLVPLENLAAYAYRALRNRIVDQYRARRPVEPLDPGTLQDLLPDPLEVADQAQLEARLFAALDALKPIERDVVVAQELEGRSFRELSEAWGIPLNTLLSHKSRALAKLRRRLAP